MQVSGFTFAPDLASVRNELSVKDISSCLVAKSGPYLFATPWTIADQDVTPWNVGSSVHAIFQARRLEWVAISFSNHSSRSELRISSGMKKVTS